MENSPYGASSTTLANRFSTKWICMSSHLIHENKGNRCQYSIDRLENNYSYIY